MKTIEEVSRDIFYSFDATGCIVKSEVTEILREHTLAVLRRVEEALHKANYAAIGAEQRAIVAAVKKEVCGE